MCKGKLPPPTKLRHENTMMSQEGNVPYLGALDHRRTGPGSLPAGTLQSINQSNNQSINQLINLHEVKTRKRVNTKSRKPKAQ